MPSPCPLKPTEVCQWLVTYPPSMRRRQTNFAYTQAEAEAKFGPGWCEPVLETRCSVVAGGYGGDSTPVRVAD